MPSDDEHHYLPEDLLNETNLDKAAVVEQPLQDDEDYWSRPAKKSKKKKDKKKTIRHDFDFEPALEEDNNAQLPAVAPPSEPTVFHGVSLDDDFPPDNEVLIDEELPKEDAVVQEARHPSPPPSIDEVKHEGLIDTAEQPPPSSYRAYSATKSSPRPAPVRPVQSSFAPPPPSRPPAAPYHSPPQQRAQLNTTRSNSSASAQPLPRRESFPASHSSPRPRFVEPVAPPHMAQPHFYGLPDFGLNFGQKKDQGADKAAGSDGYCCCFDTFADCGDAASAKRTKDALLVGSECGLEVFRVLPNKFELVGRLEGLRGSVIGAKVLPHVDKYDALQSLRPLVAVIVHGKFRRETEDDYASAKTDHYQTTVEIYSLQTQQHVTTLYKSVLVPVEPPTIGHLSSVPGAVGDLSVTAHGRYVVVASGKSGELFVFSNATTATNVEPIFRCIGKYWTTLQRSLESSRPTSSSDAPQNSENTKEKPRMPLFSLSQRWLALTSPATSDYISIQGSPFLSEHSPNPPALSSHTAPPQNLKNCEIAGVDEEDAWSRLTRQATQGVMKYSQKGIDLGWQGWRELTNPTPQSGYSHGRSSSKEDHFPPTKAPPGDPRRDSKEPAVVSIIDLDTLLYAEDAKPKYPPAPLATFALAEGCNFLSFSSSGLRLLTVSRKGEISSIWDMTQANHGVAKLGAKIENGLKSGPCVKLIHRFQRQSQSVVIDSAWSRDDDALALLTTHGTVHLHEVPVRAPSRKRKRRGTMETPVPDKAEATVSVSQGVSPPSSNGLLGSIKSSWQSVSTSVNTMRSHNAVSSLGIPTSFAGFKEATAHAGTASGRVLAKGISSGFSAAKGGASDYWHADDNKIRHKALQDQTGASGSLRWVKKQSETSLAIVCGGIVHLHPVSRIERRSGDKMVSGLKHDRYGQKHFTLPTIRTCTDGNATQTKKGGDDCSSEGPHGFWSWRSATENGGRRPNAVQTKLTAPGPSPQASEVETNPPYCPFHIDSRVDICAFDDTAAESQAGLLEEPPGISLFHLQGHGLQGEQPWIFGQPLPPSVKMNTHDRLDDTFDRGRLEEDSEMDEIADQVQSTLTVHAAENSGGSEEIRVHTQRNLGQTGHMDDARFDDDDGFDE